MTQVKEFLIGVGSVMDIHSTRLGSSRPVFLDEKIFSPEEGLHSDWVAVGDAIRGSINESHYVSKSK